MVLKFGEFEFAPAALRLTRGGRPVRLTGQSLQLLVLLLEQPGNVVAREEIQRRLWPDAHVDFDHSLNVALNRLRITLGDRSKDPLFIETVPKVGYRFVAPVSRAMAAPNRGRWRPRLERIGWYVLTAVAAALLALALVHQHYGKIVERFAQSSR